MNEHPAGLLHTATTPVDCALVILAAAIVLWAFYAAARYTIRPGEEDPHHVKRRIIVDEETGESRVSLDDEQEARAVLDPPATLELDTTQLPDGRHRLRVQAIDDDGTVGLEEIPFIVRNGPGIAVVGLSTEEAIRGRVPIVWNAFSSRLGDAFEPVRAETPAPIPTWTWVLALVVVAWAMWYSAIEFQEYRQRNLVSGQPTAQSAAPVENVPGSQATWAVLGEQVFENKCATCHQVSGMGVARVFPPLARDAIVNAKDPGRAHPHRVARPAGKSHRRGRVSLPHAALRRPAQG